MAFKAVRCRIPELTVKAGLELQQVALRAEISQTQLSDYVSMRRIAGCEIGKSIAHVLGVTIDDLYEWKYFRKKERGE